MDEPHLKRDLGLIRTTMLGIGGTLSAANFVIIGEAAGMAGYAVVPIVVICGLLSLLTMFSYAELGTAIPLAGGEYTFSKVAYGGFTSFLTGWFEWLSNMFYAALSAIGFAYVVSYLFPQINIPLTAVLLVIVFSIINLRKQILMGEDDPYLSSSVKDTIFFDKTLFQWLSWKLDTPSTCFFIIDPSIIRDLYRGLECFNLY